MAKDTKKKAQALPEAEETPAAPKKSRKKRIIIFLVVLLCMLAGVGAGCYWWFFIHKPGEPLFASKTEEAASEKVVEQPANDKGAGAAAEPSKDGQARIEPTRDIPRSKGVVLPLPLITVNLYENGGHRYLKLGMEVEANKDISAAVKENEARIRDAVIMLLAGKSYREIASPDGKVMLKVEVANRLNQILGEPRVIRVYFTDFVVQ